MTQNERLNKLEKRIASLEKTLEELSVMLQNLWKITLQMDADLSPMRRIGPGLLPKDLEGK